MEAKITQENVRAIGRCRGEKDGICFDWTGSGLAFRFRGTQARVFLEHQEQNMVEWAPFLTVQTDEGAPHRVWAESGALLTLCEGLPCAEHTVRVIKSSETGTSPVKAKYLQLSGEGEADAELLSPPELPVRRIEFVGDSITCGFGNMGVPEQSYFLTAEEDGRQSYAGITASRFGADAHMISFSGRGIVFNCDGTTEYLIPQFYKRVFSREPELWDFTKWQPDVVVINAGTNDDGGGFTTAQQMREGVLSFLRQVRQSNPTAQILWCYGMMVDRLEPVIREAVKTFAKTDSGVSYLRLEPVSAVEGEVGVCGHPSIKGHQKAAAKLVEKIAEMTGWQA